MCLEEENQAEFCCWKLNLGVAVFLFLLQITDWKPRGNRGDALRAEGAVNELIKEKKESGSSQHSSLFN